jgi:hypothetical protein
MSLGDGSGACHRVVNGVLSLCLQHVAELVVMATHHLIAILLVSYRLLELHDSSIQCLVDMSARLPLFELIHAHHVEHHVAIRK